MFSDDSGVFTLLSVFVIIITAVIWLFKRVKQKEYRLDRQAYNESIRHENEQIQIAFNELILLMLSLSTYDKRETESDINLFDRYEHKYCKYLPVIRNLELILESFDIVKKSVNKKTIASRFELIDEKLLGLRQQESYFKPETFNFMNKELVRRRQFIRTLIYVNVAKKQLEKSEEVVRDSTKQKYKNLAIETLKEGLTDPEADHYTLQAMINQFNMK
nr:hypothetical protein [uncultured Psychrobacter sp.]